MQNAAVAYSSSSTGRLGVIAALLLLGLFLFTISSKFLGSSEAAVSDVGNPRHVGSSPKITGEWVSDLVKSEVQVGAWFGCVCVCVCVFIGESAGMGF